VLSMKNKDKYAKKWYERYLTIAIGCTILSISYIIMLMYFLLIEKFFDKVLICFFLIMLLFFIIATIFAFIKCKRIKKDIDSNNN